MKENIIKAVISTALAGFAVYFNALSIPVIILILVLIGDYITGMIKAWITGKINSRIGIVGIVKKLCYLLVVCCAMVSDWIIQSAVHQAGIKFDIPFAFGFVVIIWLIINEIISMLENLSVIGVPMPSFLMKIVKKLKITVEEKADSGEE
ncbi:MAG: phage holin family protein [Clostridiales bacterium]|nr:phage holin family protein [Clostridiales bacterium]